MNYFQVILKVMPIIVLIGIGYGFKRFRFIDNETIAGLKKIVISVALPALLFATMSQIHFEWKYVYVFVVVFGVMCAIFAISGWAAGKIGLNLPHLPFLLASSETGLFGYALFASLFGTESVRYLGVADLGNMFFYNTVAISVLLKPDSGKNDWKMAGRTIVTSPIMWAIGLGTAVGISGLYPAISQLPVPMAIYDTLQLIGQLVIPMIGILIGYEMNLLKGHFKVPAKTSLMRIFILLPIAWLMYDVVLAKWIPVEPMVRTAMLTLWLLPPSFATPIFIKSGDSFHKEYVINTLSLYIPVSIGLFILMMLATGSYP